MLLKNPRLAGTLAVLILGVILLYWVWSDVMLSIVTWQQALHARLAEHIREISAAPVTVGSSLMALSLFYGVFHAAGPGHGKAVLVTYLATQRENIRQSVFIAISAALVQALVAVGLISIIALMLDRTFRDTQQIGMQVQLGSYVLVILLGAYLAGRALWQRWKHRQPTCSHTANVVEPMKWRQTLALILSMGLRPCSGALLVLIYAHLVDVYWYGVAATFAMAIGTALTVSTIAILSVLLRDRLTEATVEHHHDDHHGHAHSANGTQWVSLAGGIILLFLGSSLLVSGWSVTQNHPLF